MINKFTFHPIGQGLFYTGQLGCDYFYPQDSRYNFIFDCGSLSGDNFLHSAIDNYLASLHGQDIDLCVISHLHCDHYNGLEYLLKQVRINRIVLPYLPNDSMVRFVVLVGQFFNGSGTIAWTQDIIQNLKILSNLYGIDEIWPIEGHRPEMFFSEEMVGTFRDNNTQCFQYNIISNRFPSNWQIECYNKTLSNDKWQKLSNDIVNELQKRGFDNISDLLNYSPTMISEIAKIYRKYFKNQNPTSIIMKHYPKSNSYGLYPNYGNILHHYLDCYERNCLWREIELFGRKNANITILTGDAEFDKDLCKIVFNDYSGIDVLQLPHHGSYNNYNKLKLPKLFSGKCIVSFGLGNQYHHPNHETIDALKDMKYSELIEVNQNNTYKYFIAE